MSWLALELYERGMVRVGWFKLSSGLESPFYIDLRRLYMHPNLARRVAMEIVERVGLDDVDVVLGVATGGLPLASYISCITGKPLAYVRSERKNHGLSSLIEGDVAGLRILVVDDVSTTGSSIARAVSAVREAGGIPLKASVVVDREQGASSTLAKLGVKLYWLITAREIFEELHKHGLISEREYKDIMNYLKQHAVG
ncbi:MAG: orotate phosphoribosyltransferase [Desulfurococcus sp.]|nr:orotate phosphoribosyltransferase [Desulfurococcus sp.]